MKGDSMMNIMVTGATGGYGSYAVEFVKKFAPEARLYGLIHNPAKAAGLEAKGIIPRIGDYSDKDSMLEALKGIDRLLFVSVATPGVQKNVVDAAVEDGVKFIAYTSLHDLQYEKFGLEINHRQTEEWIRESGIPHTFLRNGWYLEMAAPMAAAAIRTGEYPYFAGESKVAWALKREYAEAGARVITGEGFSEVLELSGEPVSYREIGEAAQKLTDKKIELRAGSREEYQPAMRGSGISQMGLMLADAYQAYAAAGNNGEEDSKPDTFERTLGHPLTPLAEALREIIDKGVM